MSVAVGGQRRQYRANPALLCIDTAQKRVRRYYRRPDGRVMLWSEHHILSQAEDLVPALNAILEKRV